MQKNRLDAKNIIKSIVFRGIFCGFGKKLRKGSEKRKENPLAIRRKICEILLFEKDICLAYNVKLYMIKAVRTKCEKINDAFAALLENTHVNLSCSNCVNLVEIET